MEIINAVQPLVRVAILDLYDNFPNQGMRCIKQIIHEQSGVHDGVLLDFDVFECRYRNEFPNAEQYDIYISTGGPGSPYDGEGKQWEKNYFKLIEKLWGHNQNQNDNKKHVFFICHSFQMVVRLFDLGHVTQRRSTSFGVFPVHKTIEGMNDSIMGLLPDPFYAVDSRDWQVVQPNFNRMREIGAQILSLEKIRPHVNLERAVMAMRISNEFFGTQFHPEADPIGMSIYFQQEERREQVIKNHGLQKYQDMIEHLNDPDKIMLTYSTLIPAFLNQAIMQNNICFAKF
ncbi:MAG: GMP synthase [Cytophagales bacterium]|nr:GMP synthase [Bernardetiaceae bacterium]MDW8205798.1 GMP synthase [Cytophagales bacterium]